MAKNLRLKAARAEHDMTQGDLAEAVGATRQTIGSVSYTHLDVYKRQARYRATVIKLIE